MALSRDDLADAFKTAFSAGLADPAWTSDDAAEALADAIHAYVTAAEVTGVTTDVVDAGANPIGSGTQTGTGSLA